ncbi:MAG: M48 family metallopeptidase [Chitinophagales bacterium]|nr:M48 family metallopeptidase [Chitinophagales bacterium]
MNQKTLLAIQDLPVPVKIIIETRSSARIALRKKQIIIRIPKGMSAAQRDKSTLELIEWAKKTIAEKDLYSASPTHHFETGSKIEILGQSYNIEQQFVSGNRAAMRFAQQNQIKFQLPIHLSNNKEELHQHIQNLFIKGLNKYFLTTIQKRVHELNRLHFQADIGKISLRYTTSRWGSCSSNGTISLSTRLLLVPQIVCDYVIIHELAHRFEMNHSERFWALVEKAMPDYKRHLHWLKTESRDLWI